LTSGEGTLDEKWKDKWAREERKSNSLYTITHSCNNSPALTGTTIIPL
jgi:hypothetical protein